MTALVLGAGGAAICHGLYGFNAVLTGIALGGLFRVLEWQSTIYAFIGAIFSAIVFAVIAIALSSIGMPALTAPFVLTTWVFLLPMAGFRALEWYRSPSAPRQSAWPDCAPQSRPARSRLRRLEAFGTRCYFGFGA